MRRNLEKLGEIEENLGEIEKKFGEIEEKSSSRIGCILTTSKINFNSKLVFRHIDNPSKNQRYQLHEGIRIKSPRKKIPPKKSL